MNISRFTMLWLVLILGASLQAAAADANLLAKVTTQADLDAVIASTADPALKQALLDHAPAILAAAAQRPHVEAVARTVEGASGKVERINATPESLKKAAGGDLALFDTLRLVDLAIPNAGPHDPRKVDPFDAAFFEHLGHITPLESLNVIATKANDQWIAPLGQLTNLKTLRLVNNGKLTDAGLQHLAGLRQLESFGYIGTGMQGHAFAKFEGWTKLRQCSFRGSALDDEGLALICDRFANLESLSLAHAKFTDAGAVHLAKLTKLKGLEIGTHNATPQSLQHLARLPLEYLQLGEGFDKPESVALVAGMKSLRRLTLTEAKALSDADLKQIASMTWLENLELNNLDLPEERLPQLQGLTFLKSLRLVHRPHAYPEDIQARIKGLLPRVALKFD